MVLSAFDPRFGFAAFAPFVAISKPHSLTLAATKPSIRLAIGVHPCAFVVQNVLGCDWVDRCLPLLRPGVETT
jgi:hypothetical protein